MTRRCVFKTAGAALLPLLGFCAATPLRAVVTDRHGTQTEVFAVESCDGALEVLSGLSTVRVKLNDVKVLELSPAEVKTVNGELYYLAELWLADGTKMEPVRLANGQTSESYVNVTPRITAKTPSGTFDILLKDIKQLRFLSAK